MLKNKRSGTPAAGGGGGGGGGASSKKASAISLQQERPGASSSSSNTAVVKGKKHHSTSALPNKSLSYSQDPEERDFGEGAPRFRPGSSLASSSVLANQIKWWENVVETVFVSESSDPEDIRLHFELCGGADQGQFPYVGRTLVDDPSQIGLHVSGGVINEGDVILEIQGQKISGFTAADVARWFKHCLLQNQSPVLVMTVPKGRPTFIFSNESTESDCIGLLGLEPDPRFICHFMAKRSS